MSLFDRFRDLRERLLSGKPESPDTPLAESRDLLADAIAAGNLSAVMQALQGGTYPRQTGPDGYADWPIRLACERGHTAIARFLIAAGADIHAADREGADAPLRQAARHRRGEMVLLLLQHGILITKTALAGLSDADVHFVLDQAEKLRTPASPPVARKPTEPPPASPPSNTDFRDTLLPTPKAAKASVPLANSGLDLPPLTIPGHADEKPTEAVEAIIEAKFGEGSAADIESIDLNGGYYGVDTGILGQDMKRLLAAQQAAAKGSDKK